MDKQSIRKTLNVILVIAYTYVHYFHIGSLIIEYTESRLIAVGVWLVIVGVWGNLVGMVIINSIFVSKSYKHENYYIIIMGIVVSSVGAILILLE